MKKVMFVCLGNICRSPMAEFMFKKMVESNNESGDYIVSSTAVSMEEYHNPMQYGAREVLTKNNVPFTNHRAELLKKTDYEKYDYFIGMDSRNKKAMLDIFGGDKDKKVYILSDFGGFSGDVPDPYWTGDFEGVYETINKGLISFYNKINNK